jgi:hypothetical protein
MKLCKRCLTEKSESEFYKDSAKKDKLTTYCKICCKDLESAYHKNNPVKKSNRKRKNMISKSGLPITMNEYNHMLHTQDNKCGICDLVMKTPCIDHNHTTGVIRMLICNSCNTMLGMAKEDQHILKNAIEYLRKFS